MYRFVTILFVSVYASASGFAQTASTDSLQFRGGGGTGVAEVA